MNIETAEAWLDDIMLEVETLEDGFEKAIARYEYPFADGVDTDDLGQRAHTVRVRCYFWDNEAQTTYDDHVRLVNHLASRELVEFIHPQYGILKGRVESVSVRHDDRLRTAEVDLAFVEQLRGTIEPPQSDEVAETAEEDFLDGLDEMEETLAEDIGAALGAEGDTLLDKVLAEGQGIYEQFQGLSARASEFVREIDTYVDLFEATVTEVTNPVNSLIATINFGANLPGRVVGSVTRAIERVALLNQSLISAPGRYLDNLIIEFRRLETAVSVATPSVTRSGAAARAGMLKQVKLAAGHRLALASATVYRDDENTRRKLRRAEQTRAFDALGNLVRRDDSRPVMDVRELERSLAAVRGYLQEGVDAVRAADSLKRGARRLLEHVNTVKLEREKIVATILDNPLPLHLVCLRQGLPHTYTERIHSINRLAHPTFARGEINVYTR